MRFNQTTSGDTYRVNSTMKYPADGSTWVHVAATYDGTTIRLYVDGVLNNSLTPTTPPAIVTNNLSLGVGWIAARTNADRLWMTPAHLQPGADPRGNPGLALRVLSISKTGTGSGTVTSSPTGIDCGATCSYAFLKDTVVTLTATEAIGSTFTG